MTKFKLMADGPGLIVPINIEAMCVHDDAGSIFTPAPYNFTKLPDSKQTDVPNLSEKVMTGGLVNMDVGVHLHWALPDGLTRGQSPQDNKGSIAFPSTPDRWMVTRVYSDISNLSAPVNRVKSWVIESNYISVEQPDVKRFSISVPYKNEEVEGPQYRFLGRVQEYETWHAQFLRKQSNPSANDEDDYVEGLSAVGYGSPEFSASYHTCKSIFGFYDTDIDLDKLGNNIILSYNVIGWYSKLSDDPMSQLPLQFDPAVFDDLLEKITAPEDKVAFKKAYIQAQPEGKYILVNSLSVDDKTNLFRILTAAGFSFLGNVLNQCKWSLPSGTVETNPPVTHTLLTGIISKVIWNKKVSSFKAVDDKINIAVGNTSSQALAALIASVSEIEDQPNVELLLDALQLGKLKGVTDASSLNRLEDLMIALHTSGYNTGKGGYLWEVNRINDEQGKNNLTALALSMANDLNELNQLQLDYDNGNFEIESMRTQIFMDWYRFLLILRRGKDPDHGMKDVGAIAEMISGEIAVLDEKANTNTDTKIIELANAIAKRLPKDYELVKKSAARYWEPSEPVVLFQGNAINPPLRYGGDGRFMANDTMVCRLSSQLVTGIVIPANLIGNPSALTFNKENTPQLSKAIPLEYSEQIHALFTESCLLNGVIMGVQALANGASGDFNGICNKLKANRDNYMAPPVPQTFTVAQFEAIKAIISDADLKFFLTLYTQSGENYILTKPAGDITASELKRLDYIFVSTASAWGSQVQFSGLAPSLIYVVEWDGNPWLPFSFSWDVTYYPFKNNGSRGIAEPKYAEDFIYKNFTLGDVTYSYKGDVTVPPVYQSYKNSIFMSPHAEENFQTQIKKYLEGQPKGPLDPELREILEALKNFPPILSQAFNGINDAMIMRNLVMQLQVKDPVPSGFSNFTNVLVKKAVASMTKSAPSPGNFYNPIRAGVMSISSLTIVDVFGRNIKIATPEKIILAENLKAQGLPANYVFLSPRIVQPSRLMFRWLAADNNEIEMNSHPSTSAICGWLLSNHLDSSLWVYNNEGAPLGSLIISEDYKRVIWQGVPGGNNFGMTLPAFLNSPEGKKVNEQLKKLVLALFNGGEASYLDAFMRANDTTYSLIQPENYRQMGSNAVLMGSPIAVAQANLKLEVQGLPAYSMSWEDMAAEVNDGKPKNDNDFTKVKFPVRLGNMEQTNDGLLGYFKEGDYDHYYVMHTKNPTDKVSEPSETNITLALDETANETMVTLLFDPRGGVHATSGVLPVKQITIPPDQFADALQSLEIAFLTTPVLYNNNKPALPVPAEGGSDWSWLQNELTEWSKSQNIAPVDDRAMMTDPPQEIKEGWLLLNNFTK